MSPITTPRAALRKLVVSNGPLRRAFRRLRPLPLWNDAFLADCRSIVHVGANDGAERFHYESVGVNVIWIEPIPEVFAALTRNIRGFRGQEARRALAAEISGRHVTFHIANNDGASSSMFEFGDHEKIWPEVQFSGQIPLETITLDELLADIPGVDALVLDTQASELLVLKGAERLISSCRYIKSEAADFACYEGGCTLSELDSFLGQRGFQEIARHEFGGRPDVGRCFDVIWRSIDGAMRGA